MVVIMEKSIFVQTEVVIHFTYILRIFFQVVVIYFSCHLYDVTKYQGSSQSLFWIPLFPHVNIRDVFLYLLKLRLFFENSDSHKSDYTHPLDMFCIRATKGESKEMKSSPRRQQCTKGNKD